MISFATSRNNWYKIQFGTTNENSERQCNTDVKSYYSGYCAYENSLYSN